MILGIDPGLSGAMAAFDYRTGRVSTMDMPTYSSFINRAMRKRVDPVELLEALELYKMTGVELVILEAVSGRPKQSAGGGFAFGYVAGMIYMGCVAARLPVEFVSPTVWKKAMKLPNKKDGGDKVIMRRAIDMFPDDKGEFYGPRGGDRVDRAEAALMAVWGYKHALKLVSPDTPAPLPAGL